MRELLAQNNNDLSNDDLAVIADWAGTKKFNAPDSNWKRAYALLREGADTLLRRRARLDSVVRNEEKKP